MPSLLVWDRLDNLKQANRLGFLRIPREHGRARGFANALPGLGIAQRLKAAEPFTVVPPQKAVDALLDQGQVSRDGSGYDRQAHCHLQG